MQTECSYPGLRKTVLNAELLLGSILQEAVAACSITQEANTWEGLLHLYVCCKLHYTLQTLQNSHVKPRALQRLWWCITCVGMSAALQSCQELSRAT